MTGSNQPTFADEMMAESQMMRLKAEDLVASLDKAATAAQITTVATIAAAHRRIMNDRRAELKSPHDEKAKAVQLAFQPWINDLDEAKRRAAERMAGEHVRTAVGMATSSIELRGVLVDGKRFVEWMSMHWAPGLIEWLETTANKLVRAGMRPDGVDVNETPKTRFVR
jgi:hypothetical protein